MSVDQPDRNRCKPVLWPSANSVHAECNLVTHIEDVGPRPFQLGKVGQHQLGTPVREPIREAAPEEPQRRPSRRMFVYIPVGQLGEDFASDRLGQPGEL